MAKHRIDRAEQRAHLAHVRLNQQGPRPAGTADLIGEPLGLRRAAPIDDPQRRAVGREPSADRGADAAGAADYEGSFVEQCWH